MAFNRGYGNKSGGYQRGGGSSRGGHHRGGRAPLEYVFTGTTYREVNGETVDDPREEWQLAITLPVVTKKGTHPLEDLIAKLTEISQTNGELGARVVFYTSPRENDDTGEMFSATNILVQPKLPAKPHGGGGRGFQDRGGGRRSYPKAGPASEDTEEESPPSRTTGRSGHGQSAERSASRSEEEAPPKKLKKKFKKKSEAGPPEYSDDVPL